MQTPQVDVEVEGQENTEEYRLRFKRRTGTQISPWHDISLYGKNEEAGVVNFVCEIPKNTKPKFEVNTKEPKNPISQDTKNGKLREYHGPIFWNYGMLPQTWEDPGKEHPDMKVKGDNDPLDVVEIGEEQLQPGSIHKVKVLGILAMIDDGELDWKVIAIRTSDPKAKELDDIEDVEAKCPGVISGIREWLRWYKTPDGKPMNKFGYNEKALNKARALEVVAETNESWKKLREGQVDTGKLWAKTRALSKVVLDDH